MNLKQVRDAHGSVTITAGAFRGKIRYRGEETVSFFEDPRELPTQYRHCDVYALAWHQLGRVVEGKIAVSHETGLLIGTATPRINNGQFPWPVWVQDRMGFDRRAGSDSLLASQCLTFLSEMVVMTIAEAEQLEHTATPRPGVPWKVVDELTPPYESFFFAEWSLNTLMRAELSFRKTESGFALSAAIRPVLPLQWDGMLAQDWELLPDATNATARGEAMIRRALEQSIQTLQDKGKSLQNEGKTLLSLVASINRPVPTLKTVS